MDLPFSAPAFHALFSEYNQAIWPVQVIAYAGGLVAVILAFHPTTAGSRTVSAILATMWIWIGLVYHVTFFSTINPAALLFGALFVVQGILLLWTGVARTRLRFAFRSDAYGVAGAMIIVYALLVYPLLGAMLGRVYPASPTFGVTPCPATIFTFGMLLWTQRPTPGWVLVIPSLWAILGVSAALQLGVLEDLALPISAFVTVALVFVRSRSMAAVTA